MRACPRPAPGDGLPLDPPIALARLRARGELAELRAADLRFDAGEAAALLDGHRARPGRRGAAAGAPAPRAGPPASTSAGLSLRGRADAAAFIDAFAGDDRLVVDYLAAEVLEGQPPSGARFLLRTSILTRLSGAAVRRRGRDRRRGGAPLAELERSNLFLVPLDSRREWYRYHHLFGELLQHELALSAPEELPELHRRAAGWYLDERRCGRGDPPRAPRGDLGAAADLIAGTGSRR